MNIDVTPTKGFPHMYDFIGKQLGGAANPTVLIILTVVIIIYYLIFNYLGSSAKAAAKMASPVSRSTGLIILETLLWGVFIFLVLVNGLQYFFKIDIKTSIKNLFTPVPEVDVSVTSPYIEASSDRAHSGEGSLEVSHGPSYDEDGTPGDGGAYDIRHHQHGGVPSEAEEQVFHIPDNKYTFEDARALCAAYDGRLADYSEIEEAYKKGGEWCGFGWSADQMVFYPTQKKTWENLQKIKGHKHDCGRPGVNGGFIRNKHARFGVNCFGRKPKMTEVERDMMAKATPYPLTPAEERFNARVKRYREKVGDIPLSPFNYSTWNEA